MRSKGCESVLLGGGRGERERERGVKQLQDLYGTLRGDGDVEEENRQCLLTRRLGVISSGVAGCLSHIQQREGEGGRLAYQNSRKKRWGGSLKDGLQPASH